MHVELQHPLLVCPVDIVVGSPTMKPESEKTTHILKLNNIYIPLLINKSTRGKWFRINSANFLMDLKDPTSRRKHDTSPLVMPHDRMFFATFSPASTFRHPLIKKVLYNLSTLCHGWIYL